jgi:HEAT repeat protein
VVREPKNSTTLINEVVNDRRKLRSLISLLYDSDIENRFMAAKALGEVARVKPEFIISIWRRILDATDDTMSCWGVAEALGEIARNMPELRGKILLRLRKFQKDESTCQGFIWAICRIGQVEIDRVKEFMPDLISFLESREPCMLGQAIWALGELRITEAMDKIKTFLNDNRQTWVYNNDSACIKTIGQIAEEAVRKLNNF